MTQEELVLIDGHALAYRMFFALPLDSFSTKAGEPTNATFGFTRTLLDLILSQDPPEYLAVSFDLGMSQRDELYGEYKGTREKMPGELAVQIRRIRQVVGALNVPILELEGCEADDVLGTIARQASAEGVPVRIITGDRDLLQLVDEHVTVELPPSGNRREIELYNREAVLERYGIEPEQFVDYKALVGDASDNIPGVKGIGDKTASKLLQDYGTLDAIYEHLDEMTPGLRSKLEDGRDLAYLSHELARIRTDLTIDLDLAACVAQDYDTADVVELFREVEFRSLTERITHAMVGEGELPALQEQVGTEAITVQTQEQLDELVAKLEAAEVISFDVETTAIEKMEAELVGISLAIEPGTGYYIPVGHLAGQAQAGSGQMSLFAGEAKLAEGQLPLQVVIDALRPALTNPNIPKVGHNAKYDYTILDRYGLRVWPITFDTMIAEWLTDPATRFKGLKGLALHRLGIQMVDIVDLIGSGKEMKTFAEVPVEEAATYSAADADITLRLVEPLQAEIQEKGQEKILEIEMPLIPVLSKMEQVGVAIDVPFFKQLAEELDERLRELEGRICDIAGEPFNINSTQQLSDILFLKLKLPHEGLRRTKSGHYSTAADILDSLKEADETGIINLLQEYRELGKLKSTYVDALPQMVNPETGRLHTSFNQTGAITGRIASTSPNLQNIPIRTEEGRKIRRGFVTEPGWQFLSADYSQVELRILAHVTGDDELVEAFRQGQDIHATTAAAVYNIPLERVTRNQRSFAKNVNFGIIYGMGAYRLARESELTLAESENYIREYFRRFPGIQNYLEETKRLARKKGYVETLLGRRRYFPVFQQRGSVNRQLEMRAEREAINHPIQGTAADIIKIAMIELHEQLSARYQARLLLQVHDELVLEAPEEELDAVEPLVVDIMCNAFQLDVPLRVETSTGQNWLELK